MSDRYMSWAGALALTLAAGVASAEDKAAPSPSASQTAKASSSATPPKKATPAAAKPPTTAPSAAEPTATKPAATKPAAKPNAAPGGAAATMAPGPATPAGDAATGAPTEAEEVELTTEGEQEAAPKPTTKAAPKDGKAAAAPPAAPGKPTAAGKAPAAPGRGRFVVGLRTGWGIPLGEAESGSDLSATATGEIPLWLDLGYRVLPSLMVGVYGQYAFPILGQCAEGADSCALHAARLGLQAQYSFGPDKSLDPWVGLGLGYEMLWGTAEGPAGSYDAEYSGFEYANVQAGADFRMTPAVLAGPFVSFSVGEFSSGTRLGGDSGDIKDTALHHWLLLGVKGSFSL